MYDRFGMFINWGLYAMPARHEWIKSRELAAREKYDTYFKYFNPDMYDPKQWAKDAKAAGIKYVVFTTKHHEGFCMFNSEYTDYKCTNTLAGRDLLREFVDAFRTEGLHIGFYYSLIDWHHPDFIIDQIHPLRDEPNVKELNEGRDMRRYAQYMRNQVEELLTNYGKIDILWLDLSYRYKEGEPYPYNLGKLKDDWKAEKLIGLVRSLQQDILINKRYNNRSICGCTMAEPELLAAVRKAAVAGVEGKSGVYAQFLHDGSELIFKEDVSVTIMEGTTWETYDAALELPVQKPNVTVPVVELFLK